MTQLDDASILVTGGSGAFGQAFVRRCLEMGAARVAIISRSEAKQAAMAAAFNDPRLRFLIGDVRDLSRMTDACRHVDYVVHAAALKRVEVCEADPREAVKTNVDGTANVAFAARLQGVRRAVFLSTDKAAAPNTLYGATKQTAERLWCGENVYAAGKTLYAATRYGNVLGSTGSVVPLWQKQAAAGGPLTVTGLGMSRFWMTMDDAVDLVLLALDRMEGGETFVPKIGRAWITDLADAIAPGVPLVEVGIRPGEKLHETLITEDEARSAYDAGSCYILEPQTATWRSGHAPARVWVGPGFTYRSDRGQMLTVEQLRRMIAA